MCGVVAQFDQGSVFGSSVRRMLVIVHLEEKLGTSRLMRIGHLEAVVQWFGTQPAVAVRGGLGSKDAHEASYF